MIIEFIGCSGAGKTTLARMLQHRSSTAEPVLLAEELVMDRPGRRWINHPTGKNLVADATVLPSFFGAFNQNREFARYAADRLKRHAPSAFAKVNYMRNIVRRIGMYELARRKGANAKVLVDEGTLLTAYYLFVYSDAPFDQADLEHFAQLVPLPDRIVYVKAPVELLVNRATERPDRRRELTTNDRQELQRWIVRAGEVFEGLSVTKPIRDRILTVENAAELPDIEGALASQIGSFINGRTPEANSSKPQPIRIRRRHDILKTTEVLIEHLNGQGVRYCHWKSNWALAETMMGRTDLDLLVHRQDVHRFQKILKKRRFVPSTMTGEPPLSSVEHYHAFDRASGTIVHVHSYYEVITGESLAKNYQLPVEKMLLTKTRREGIVNVPAAGAELVIFVLRMLVKHTTLPELMLLTRRWPEVRHEVKWLMTDAAFDQATELLSIWLPQVDAQLFSQGYEALKRPAPLLRRIALGYRIRGRLRSYARRGELRARWIGAKRFAEMVRYRMSGSSKKLTPSGGGALIAFVGSEATGKSTMLGEMEHWLARHYTVRRIHAGKPPSKLLTLIPHHLLPALRVLLPSKRSTRIEIAYAASDEPSKQAFPLLFGLRSVMLAYERKALLTRAFAWSKQGIIVLSDRYPSARGGAPDSPQLTYWSTPTGRISLRRWLTELEARLYREIPIPNLVIYLTAPLEVTLARNEARDKTEAEDFVRFRHSLSSNPEFEGTVVHHIDTDQPLEASVPEIKQAIWNALNEKLPVPIVMPDLPLEGHVG